MTTFHKWMGVIIFSIVALVMWLAALPVQAAGAACGRAGPIMATLSEQFNLVPRWKGIAPSGNLYVILSTAKGDRWVAVQIDPAKGMACIMAEGMKNEFMMGQGV